MPDPSLSQSGDPVTREQAREIAEEVIGQVKPAVAELIAAGDGLAKLIADGTAGKLTTDMEALRRWSEALRGLHKAFR